VNFIEGCRSDVTGGFWPLLTITRHSASTSMYSLTFRVRVTTPPQYGPNGTAHAAGAWMLIAGEGSRSSPACVVRAVGLVDYRWALPRCHAFPCCHSNATSAPIANLPNSAQLGGIPYHSAKLHPGPCNSVGIRPRTDRQTQTCVTTIHFSWSTTHAKCNDVIVIRD